MPNEIELSGSWKIQVSQKVNKKRLSYSIDCTISHIGTQVIGTLYYDLTKINYKFKSGLKNKQRFTLPFEGTVQGRQLQMVYNNNKRKLRQLGSIILNIKSNDNMEGLFIGYGPESRGLISGDVTFQRVIE